MEDQPYDFIDGDAPEKRKTNRKMAKAARERELFGGSSNNNSSSNNSRSDRDKTSRDKTDNPARSDSPFLLRVLDRLFKRFK